MSVVLPTKKVAAETQDPKNLIIYGAPKVGKTTLLAELPESLLIDTEGGSSYVSAVKVKATNLPELTEVCKAILDAGKPYKFLILDTITALEEMCKPLAAKLYMSTPMGKNYTGGAEGILNLPQGAGSYRAHSWLIAGNSLELQILRIVEIRMAAANVTVCG